MMPGLLNLILLIVIFGVVMWAINVFIPMPAAIKSLLNVFVLIILIIYILQFFSIIPVLIPAPMLFK